jgi:hypothetical protein
MAKGDTGTTSQSGSYKGRPPVQARERPKPGAEHKWNEAADAGDLVKTSGK